MFEIETNKLAPPTLIATGLRRPRTPPPPITAPLPVIPYDEEPPETPDEPGSLYEQLKGELLIDPDRLLAEIAAGIAALHPAPRKELR